MTTAFDEIPAMVKSRLEDLALTLGVGGVELPWNIRKLPRAKKFQDKPPCGCICPAEEPEEVRWMSSEGRKSVVYVTDIITVASGGGDYSPKNLDVYGAWRKQIRDALLVPAARTLGVTGLYRVECRPMPPLDRELLQEGYDFSGNRFRWFVIE